MAAYATADDLVARYDERTIRDLLSDDGTPVTERLTSHTRLTSLLEAASGRVEAASLNAKMYTAVQLAALTGNSLGLLKDIVCDLAMIRLIMRRPEKFSSEQIKDMREAAEGYLEQLRKGERLFAIDANIDAGLPTIDGPTAVDYERLNLIPDRIRNYYPSRARRLPIGRAW
jgi:phage gp36-like protein